jgi:hypothetical protein
MTFSSRAIRSIFIFSFVFFLAVQATLFLPETHAAQLAVLSEYQGAGGDESFSSRRWAVTIEDREDATRSIRFYVHQSRAGYPICEITVTPEEDGAAITWQGKRKGRDKTTSNGLMVLPGYPAPCDMLPSNQAGAQRSFQERAAADKRVFVKQYHLSYQDVSRAEAIEQGWLKAGSGHYPAFHMRTVVDDQENLVVRQLWPEDGSWWVYEETRFRRSWLVGE